MTESNTDEALNKVKTVKCEDGRHSGVVMELRFFASGARLRSSWRKKVARPRTSASEITLQRCGLRPSNRFEILGVELEMDSSWHQSDCDGEPLTNKDRPEVDKPG